MTVIIVFFVTHWLLSVLAQTFFLHRYGAHRMFTMSHRTERVFHFLTWLLQGSSYLNPRAYAILHREHHAFSDTVKDPHSPHFFKDVFSMMWQTKERYFGHIHGTVQAEERFKGPAPSWPLLDRIGDSWLTRGAFAVAYTLVYVAFAPHWLWYALIPIHVVMGPLHGAIVNWAGHKYGYRNFNSDDKSRNTLPFDFLTAGELFQNNHHKFAMSPNFAVRKWELDPTWPLIRALAWLKVIKLAEHGQKMRFVTQKAAIQEPVAEREVAREIAKVSTNV
jgi:stearoyl-CoA desaturase (delta-9 desaturase)